MATLLPPSTDITSSGTTQGGAKVYHAAIRAFIAALLGTDAEDKPAARAALGAQAASDILSGIAAGTSPTSYKNLLINSNFQINNGNAGTPYVSGATLAAGQTGHECWKAGASGGDYTFTQNAAVTGITIASGKSGIQVIEAKFVRGGTYILHWTGTAKCRAGVNSATPSGTYVTSPLVITGQSVGVTMSIEVANDGSGGTFSEPQLERSLIASAYEFGSDEQYRTQRYFETGTWYMSGFATAVSQTFGHEAAFSCTKVSAPTMASIGNTLANCTSAFSAPTINKTNVNLTASAAGGFAGTINWTANSRL